MNTLGVVVVVMAVWAGFAVSACLATMSVSDYWDDDKMGQRLIRCVLLPLFVIASVVHCVRFKEWRDPLAVSLLAMIVLTGTAAAQVVVQPAPVAVAVPQPPVIQWYQPQPYMVVPSYQSGPFGLFYWRTWTTVPVQPVAQPAQAQPQSQYQAPVR